MFNEHNMVIDNRHEGSDTMVTVIFQRNGRLALRCDEDGWAGYWEDGVAGAAGAAELAASLLDGWDARFWWNDEAQGDDATRSLVRRFKTEPGPERTYTLVGWADTERLSERAQWPNERAFAAAILVLRRERQPTITPGATAPRPEPPARYVAEIGGEGWVIGPKQKFPTEAAAMEWAEKYTGGLDRCTVRRLAGPVVAVYGRDAAGDEARWCRGDSAQPHRGG